jgi:hypothetical protein
LVRGRILLILLPQYEIAEFRIWFYEIEVLNGRISNFKGLWHQANNPFFID